MKVSLDQHLMVDIRILEKIAKSAGIKKSDRILEIGAGTGNLTAVLAASGAKITAVELDHEMISVLRKRFSAHKNVKIVEGNGLKLLKRLEFDKIVSNIPYAICEPLIQILKEIDFKSAVLTIPEKFSDNLASESKLGMETSIFFDMKRLFRAPKSAFTPEPDTESVVVLLKPKDSPLKTVLLKPKSKLKNAFMEALVEARKCTKNQAREEIKAMELSNNLLEKQVNSMDLNDLLQLKTKFRC